MDTFDDGIVSIYTLENISEHGNMPKQRLVQHKRYYFHNLMVSYDRSYKALGVNEHIDMLIRIWQDRTIRIGMYAMIDDEQFRITNCQQLYNADGLQVTDITLTRMNENYDLD